jgi:hypothetical protein
MPEPHCLCVDIHDHVPVVFIDIHEETWFVQTGIEDTDIDRAEGLHRCGHRCRIVLPLRDIHLHGYRLAVAGRIDAVGDLLRFVEIQIAQADIGALLGEGSRHSPRPCRAPRR